MEDLLWLKLENLEISDYDDEIDFNNFFAPSKNDEHIAWKPLDV